MVLDYEATEHIFHHFYGKRANYNGYMNKFISRNVYKFNIVEAARRELISQLCSKCSVDEKLLGAIPVNGIDNIETITLSSIINKLSVREIVHILDDLENQIFNYPLEFNGYRIKNVAPITILLAVLVRLNQPINYTGLFQYILDKSLILSLFQQYLLCDSFFACCRPFRLNRECWVVSPKKGNDGVYDVNIGRRLGSFSPDDDVRDHLMFCFKFAMKNVKDCLY